MICWILVIRYSIEFATMIIVIALIWSFLQEFCQPLFFSLGNKIMIGWNLFYTWSQRRVILFVFWYSHSFAKYWSPSGTFKAVSISEDMPNYQTFMEFIVHPFLFLFTWFHCVSNDGDEENKCLATFAGVW